MMIHQTLHLLTQDLLKRLPQYNHGISLAIIDSQGRVLKQTSPEKNEFEWAGITDTLSDYFYIRHRDTGEITHEVVQAKSISSCGNYTQINTTYELRLVSCRAGADPYLSADGLLRALMSANVSDSCNGHQVSIIPVRSQISSMAVVQEESGKEKQFDPNLIFVSLDFNLTISEFL